MSECPIVDGQMYEDISRKTEQSYRDKYSMQM